MRLDECQQSARIANGIIGTSSEKEAEIEHVLALAKVLKQNKNVKIIPVSFNQFMVVQDSSGVETPPQ